ncbi:ABC transporter permease [Corynebacterium kozikiae]|uniref:ABC transporter permease n=1 Tax=Corynebacterium kozikiae TaxID=2968469 RepID=UPI00211C49B2|nr:ABC transporter permease [Corynebacterium sp. 76QC2CO]MCQ9342826.1 ABC transporter permease [Corynebacterium sp. 76QC2CO]
MLAAQTKMEAKLFLRHGEQQLLSFVIPLAMLIAIATLPLLDSPQPLQDSFPVLLAIAAMSSGFTGQAISLAFDRRYGALKRTGASGVPSWVIVSGKVLGVAVVSLLQVVLLTVVALLFGWNGNFGLGIGVFAVGVVAFGAMGLLMGGTLSSELVLGLANLIWFALVGVASYLIFVAPEVPRALELIPSVALSQGLVHAFDGVFPGFEILILLGWAAAAAIAAIKWFKFA